MRNSSFINCLIQKENEVIKSYEGYVSRVTDEDSVNMARECIERHNNHIETLKSIAGR